MCNVIHDYRELATRLFNANMSCEQLEEALQEAHLDGHDVGYNKALHDMGMSDHDHHE